MSNRNLIKRILKEVAEERNLRLYALDWDDNILGMPTKIYLKDDEGNSIGMPTDLLNMKTQQLLGLMKTRLEISHILKHF